MGESGGAVDLTGKQNIRELELHWETESDSQLHGNLEQQQLRLRETLEPHSNIKPLVIGGYGGSNFRPGAIRLFKIYEGCSNCGHLPGFVQLPFLEHLNISGMRYLRHLDDDDDFHGGGGVVATFPSLKSLKSLQLPCLEKLCKQDGRADVFPCLSELDMQGCPKLSLPCLMPLKELRVCECSNILRSSISNLPHLTLLSLWNSKDNVCFPEGMLRSLTALQSLEVVVFEKVEMLPTQLENLGALKSLTIRWNH